MTRFSPFSAQGQAGNVKIVRGAWNDRWFGELEAFPEASQDDSADSAARALNALIAPPAPAKRVNLSLMARGDDARRNLTIQRGCVASLRSVEDGVFGD